jgi:hypothetical protein
MSENVYDKGDLVRCTGTFTDAIDNNAAVDPTVVNVSVRDPSGNVTTYVYNTDDEVNKSGTGIYYIDVNLDEAGRWYYRWHSTGTGQAAGENTMVARQPVAE